MGSQASRKPTRSDNSSPAAGDSFGRDLANWLFPIYLAVILGGLMIIRTWGMQPGGGNGVRAMFAALNAATLTGFRQNPGLGGLSLLGQYVVFFLIIAGSLFNMVVGGLAVRRIARLRFSDGDIIRGAIVIEAMALIVGGIMLADPQRPAFHSVFLAASAFGNCGLFPGALPDETSGITHLVILPLSILGGLGITVLLELPSVFVRSHRLSRHSITALSTSAWLYVIGFLLLFAMNLSRHSGLNAATIQLAAQSSVLSIESRTCGLNLVSSSLVSPSSQWILIALMAIGASPGGTGGGLKTTTLAELIRGASRLLHGQSVARPLGIAITWLGIYAAMVLGAAILLAHLDFTGGGDAVIFNAVSGVSNVGLSVAELPDESRLMYGYSAIILLGRMAPMLILWWMADTTTDADVAIG